MSATATNEADNAIRRYLQFLEDPSSLIDHELVASLEARIDATADPLDRLHAIAEYERARHPDEQAYRQAFIDHAKAWAQANDVPATAFRALGVPHDVLTKAGITQPSAAVSVTAAALKDAARRIKGQFTAADLVRAAGGGSPMTVRKAINEMLADGELVKLGPVPNWNTRGRAPHLFERP